MQVSAQLNNLRRSPRKVRLVANSLKGLSVKEAEEQLMFLIKGTSPDFQKLLRSAVANAQNNFGLDKNNLFVKDIVVDEGTKLKRWLPRAHGRASLLLKRTSRVKIVLEELVEGKGRKKVEKQEVKDIKKAKGVEKKEAEGQEEVKEEKKEIAKEKEEKDFLIEKKKATENKGFLKRIFRRKSM
jgi:large subunit ribosomal protein L22